jgi:hypothetical protein
MTFVAKSRCLIGVPQLPELLKTGAVKNSDRLIFKNIAKFQLFRERFAAAWRHISVPANIKMGPGKGTFLKTIFGAEVFIGYGYMLRFPDAVFKFRNDFQKSGGFV